MKYNCECRNQQKHILLVPINKPNPLLDSKLAVSTLRDKTEHESEGVQNRYRGSVSTQRHRAGGRPEKNTMAKQQPATETSKPLFIVSLTSSKEMGRIRSSTRAQNADLARAMRPTYFGARAGLTCLVFSFYGDKWTQ